MIETEEQKVARVKRIQRKFQEGIPFEQKLKYLKYLTDIDISLDILKETSIGKTVNLMRKEHGVVGEISSQLVIKWKEIATSQYGTNDGAASEEKLNNKNKSDNISSLTNQTLRLKCEESSSSPSKPKMDIEGKTLKKLDDKSYSDNNKQKLKDNNKYISNESLNTETNATNHRKDKCQKNTNDTKSSVCDDDESNTDVTKKKSFEQMLMMPMLPTTKKKSRQTKKPSYSDDDADDDDDDANSGLSNKKSKKNRVSNEGPVSDDDLNTGLSEKNSKSSKKKIQDASEGSLCDDESNAGSSKKKSKSFEEMLMMPMLPTKKKNRETKKPSNSDDEDDEDDGDNDAHPGVSNKKSKKKKHKEAIKKEESKQRMPTLPEIELPQINTTPVYRPNRPPTPSEEVKRKPPTPAAILTLRDEDITSRRTKSVMYTGKKIIDGVVPSLYQTCMRILIENVDSLYETGGVPFSVLEPMLAKCTPVQLERLEYYNPHFIADTDGLWRKHCQHTFKCMKIDADSVAAWRDTYKDLGSEREEKLRRLSSKISANQASKIPERSAKLAFLARAPKPSAQVLRMQKRFGTGDKMKEREREREKEREKEREREREKEKHRSKEKGKGKHKDKHRSKNEDGDSVSSASSSSSSDDDEKEDDENKESQKEIRERMMKEQEESSEAFVPFGKVPRRDRCSKRPPSSLTSSGSNQHPAPKKQKKDELGSVAPPEFTPTKKKKGKKPMMLKAMKLLQKQKGRMAASIMRR